MDISDKMPGIDPVRFDLDGKFKFSCHRNVKCFTKCCRGIRIVLTPYDIIKLKNRLELSSEQFLAIYTEPNILEKTDLPVITLKMMDDEQNSCPFVRDDGCIVYEDRPTTCRYYPVGVASLAHAEASDEKDFFFFVNEPHCLGFEEEKEWTIRDWRKDQGVDVHDQINTEWTDLVVRKRSFPQNIQLTNQAKQMFFMVSYNIDKLKDFIFNSSFLQRYKTDPAEIEKIKNSDIELLKFGINWLKEALFRKPQENENK